MERNNNEEELMELLSRLLEIDISTITNDTSPETVDMWDSYTGLMMALELESTFKITFTIEEVLAVRNVWDIRKALNKHGIIFMK